MSKEIISSDRVLAPVAPYSNAVRIENQIFVSGQVSVDPAGNVVGIGDIRKQTQQALENIKLILEKAGATLQDVVKTTVFLTDMRNFKQMNEVYEAFFRDNFPARSCVQALLARQEFLVEIEAITIMSEP